MDPLQFRARQPLQFRPRGPIDFFRQAHSVPARAEKSSTLVLASTGGGKSQAAARAIVEAEDEACILADPHTNSTASIVLTHATGNLLYDCVSDGKVTLGYNLLSPSTNPDSVRRQLENQLQAEFFFDILLRRRGGEGMASTPLMEEHVMGATRIFLFQEPAKPLTWFPYAFMPETPEFKALVRDCVLPDIRYRFEQLATLTYRGLRAEVGSAVRLINSIFGSPAFAIRSRGGFDLGGFLQNKGKLILEKGDLAGDDTFRVIVGAVVLRAIEHAKRRPKPLPVIRIWLDEATNAMLVGRPELRAIAECRKYGLFVNFLVQNLDFPGGPDAVLQNCLRHEFFRCSFYDLARKAAVDIAAGLPPTGESRSERIERLTHEIMNQQPGWRHVRDPSGSRKEYVPMLTDPWAPDLREAKLREKIAWIQQRPEYRTDARPAGGARETRLSSPSSASSSPPPNKSHDSSPADRWLRGRKRQADGSSASEGGES